MADINALSNLAERELKRLRGDANQPREVREEARRLVREMGLNRLRSAVADFRAAAAVFSSLNNDLCALTEKIRSNPVGDALERVTGILDAAGDAYRSVAGLSDERANSAAETEAEALEAPTEDSAVSAVASVATAPVTGQAKASTRFSEIASEYASMFQAANINAANSGTVEHFCEMAVGAKGRYESAVAGTRIPWWFVAMIHGLESSFNFGRHLHNGDSLSARTTHVPANQPPASVGDPPFTWEVSAKDALRSKRFHERTDWSLSYVLYRWECYNGLGYRKKGLASPYLWSMSDRYAKGKYVADGRFDANAVSRQVGAATALKLLESRREISL